MRVVAGIRLGGGMNLELTSATIAAPVDRLSRDCLGGDSTDGRGGYEGRAVSIDLRTSGSGG